ncbi:MAG: capsular biosynthesis protein [Chitinispirillales bacterium]|nr:capsular biosynthesis protein [Chitinispirillales bacterium]
MTHLIQLCDPLGMWYNHALLDVADLVVARGDTVKIVVCDSTIKICNSNLRESWLICAWCKSYRKTLFRQLPKNTEVLYYSDFYSPESKSAVESLTFEYNSVKEIKKLTYKNVKIGYGAFSTYVTWTRNLYPNMNNEFRDYFNRYLKAECIAAEVLSNILEKVRPDMVHLFNGRHFDTRPFFDLPKSLGYPVRTYENVRRDKKNRLFSYMFFENVLPHDIKYLCDSIKRVWDDSKLTDDKKLAIGESFFANRKASIYAGDRIYTRAQKYGALPDGFDKSKRNMAIFTSSEDEFASIGPEYDDDQLFDSQPRGIAEILERFKNDANFHFYLRVHPNLKDVKYKYHTSLLELGDMYKNVTIIKANDEISSYSLMENVEKVLVFGSTIGLEACYWGKPTILLCAAFYNYLNVCYKPKTADEAFSLIAADALPAQDKTDAVKYGFYVMYDRSESRKPMKISETKSKVLRELLRVLTQMRLLGKLKIPTDEAKD